MNEQDSWIPFQDIDWDCKDNNMFYVDTRDFHCGYKYQDELPNKVKKIISRVKYRFTKAEIITFLDRIYIESGGQGEWRFLELKSYTNDWSLKYIRIYRTNVGFILCDDYDNPILPKQTLGNVVGEPTLNFMK